jgi:hypothetical protein
VTKKQTPVSLETIAIQDWLRPALTPVLQNRDYDRLAADLSWLDATLRRTGMEELAVEFALEGVAEQTRPSALRKKAEFAVYALRAELLRHMIGLPGFESYSMTLAGSDLLTDFCGCRTVAGIRWTSKSSLHRASLQFSDEQLRQLNVLLVQAAGNREFCPQLGLESEEDLSVCLIDSTCLPANIHFPVDWVLLRDVALTLLKAVTLIRREGLLHRMPEGPDALAREMNKLCIEMTHSRRKAGSKKARKSVLRRMKKLLGRIGEHARRHRDLLDGRFAESGLSRAQAERILARMDEKLDLLPKVIDQAHERIIGERQVKNADKILSAHEPDIDVIVRGKAGAQTEFGNELFLAENPGGLIVDYMLYGKGAPSEPQKMLESVERQQALHVEAKLEALVADRGFDAKRPAASLKEQGIAGHVCPKNPEALAKRLEESEFRRWQTRRSATEARVAILKNHGGGRVWRAKGLERRRLAVGWSVLAHNLTLVGRKVREQKIEAPPKVA